MTDLKKQIDELAGIKADMSKLKARKDKLEAEIIMQCSEDLENTKYKSVHYAGTESELTAVTSESLKITYNSFFALNFWQSVQRCSHGKDRILPLCSGKKNAHRFVERQFCKMHRQRSY